MQYQCRKILSTKFYYLRNVDAIKIFKDAYYYVPTKSFDNKCVYGWKYSDGNYYLYAQKVFVSKDLLFVPYIKNSLTLAVMFHDEASISLINQMDTYTLPSVPAQIGNDVFKHWIVNGEICQPGDELTLHSTTFARALYNQLPNKSNDKKKKTAIIAGTVVAVLVVIAIVAVVVFVVVRKKNEQKSSDMDLQDNNNGDI